MADTLSALTDLAVDSANARISNAVSLVRLSRSVAVGLAMWSLAPSMQNGALVLRVVSDGCQGVALCLHSSRLEGVGKIGLAGMRVYAARGGW
jgi:hypothetical protein